MQAVHDESGSAWVASSSSGRAVGESSQYICDCGLNAVVRTSFTYQNMGKRFRGCPKFVKPCNYFHFLPGEELIEGRPKELLLILKDREQKLKRENEKLSKENTDLLQEIWKLKEENGNLKSENKTLNNDNGYLAGQCEIWIKKMKTVEKKLKKTDKDCRTANKLNNTFCVLYAVFMAVLVVILVGRTL